MTSVLGIIYARKSPERLAHSRRRTLTSLLVAVALAYMAHLLLGELNPPQAILRIVCELLMLVVGIRFMPSTPNARYRVLKMVTALLAISMLGDGVLIAISFVAFPAPLDNVQLALAGLVYASQIYGATNCVRYALATTWTRATLWAAAYVASVGVLFAITAPLMAVFTL